MEAKEATYTEDGNIEYYEVENGNIYLKDGNVYTVTTLEDVTTKRLPIVSFDTMGHGTAPESQIVSYDTKAAEPTPPTDTDYYLVGWYKDEELTEEWVFSEDTVTEDITLYAKWQEDAHAEEIAYITADYDAEKDEVTHGTATAENCALIADSKHVWTKSVYAVTDEINISTKVTVNGTVDLILCDGAVLTLQNGIEIAEGGRLNIYSQSAGTGKLIINGTNGTDAGASGVSGYAAVSGDIVVYGGIVEAAGGAGGKGAVDLAAGGDGGSGTAAVSGSLTVYDGTVTAVGGNGGEGGASYKGGNGGKGAAAVEGEMTVYGGKLTLSAGSGGKGGWTVDKSSGINGADGAAVDVTMAAIYGSPVFTNGLPFELEIIEPTFTEVGYTEHYTVKNGKIYAKNGDIYTPAELSDFEIAKLVSGDVNLDGEVNDIDAALVLKYAGEEKAFFEDETLNERAKKSRKNGR